MKILVIQKYKKFLLTAKGEEAPPQLILNLLEI